VAGHFGVDDPGVPELAGAGSEAAKAVLDATEAYLSAEDAIAEWIDEKCECDPTAWASSSELYGSWASYAVQAGEHCALPRSPTNKPSDQTGQRADHDHFPFSPPMRDDGRNHRVGGVNDGDAHLPRAMFTWRTSPAQFRRRNIFSNTRQDTSHSDSFCWLLEMHLPFHAIVVATDAAACRLRPAAAVCPPNGGRCSHP
jgi:hypothetical protein